MLSRELSHLDDCQEFSTDMAEPRQPFQRGPLISTLNYHNFQIIASTVYFLNPRIQLVHN